ncbi:LexA family protein [Streptomyces sp. NPDC047980]|uniref:LexA family protein n=1 Tax=unclassified Streptomyces TaxID=2593676 RepID=UPI00371A49C6
MREISERERRILHCIREWIADHGESPTVLEISRAVGLSSTGSTAYQLGKLQQRGLICRDRGWRSIRLC